MPHAGVSPPGPGRQPVVKHLPGLPPHNVLRVKRMERNIEKIVDESLGNYGTDRVDFAFLPARKQMQIYNSVRFDVKEKLTQVDHSRPEGVLRRIDKRISRVLWGYRYRKKDSGNPESLLRKTNMTHV